MRRLIDLLGSSRLTLALIVGLAILFGLGLIVPQKAVLQRELYEEWQARSPRFVAVLEGAGLTDVHRSPLATVLWGTFFANLALVMVRRTPGTLRRVRLGEEVPDPVDASGFSYRATLPAAGDGLERARAFFEARGYAVVVAKGRLRAVRNRLAPLATLAFHLSFFLIAAGGVISDATRFEGTVELGQGEEFTGDLGQYASPPRLPRFGGHPAPRFVVESIEPELVDDVPVRLRIRVRDATFRASTFEVNRPYRAEGASFVFKNLGVAPALVITDPEGRELFAGLMRLDVLMGKTDRFEIAGARFTAALFPDYVNEGGVESSRTQEMRNPVLRLTVTPPGGQPLSAPLRLGGAAALGPYQIHFAEWRYWVKLYVRAERGLWLIWLGFALGAAALTWRLLFFRREYVVATAEDGAALRLAARAEYYRALFDDEAAAVARELERAVAAEPPAPGAA